MVLGVAVLPVACVVVEPHAADATPAIASAGTTRDFFMLTPSCVLRLPAARTACDVTLRRQSRIGSPSAPAPRVDQWIDRRRWATPARINGRSPPQTSNLGSTNAAALPSAACCWSTSPARAEIGLALAPSSSSPSSSGGSAPPRMKARPSHNHRSLSAISPPASPRARRGVAACSSRGRRMRHRSQARSGLTSGCARRRGDLQ